MARTRQQPAVVETNEIDYNRLVQLAKQGHDMKDAADAINVGVAQMARLWYKAEVDANPKLQAPATAKSVVNLRDNLQLRWERIAARIGESVKTAKDLYREGGGDPETSFTGRGRNFNDAAVPAPRGRARAGSAGPTQPTTPARRGRQAAQEPTTPPTRARTRAQRQARGNGNPS